MDVHVIAEYVEVVPIGHQGVHEGGRVPQVGSILELVGLSVEQVRLLSDHVVLRFPAEDHDLILRDLVRKSHVACHPALSDMRCERD